MDVTQWLSIAQWGSIIAFLALAMAAIILARIDLSDSRPKKR